MNRRQTRRSVSLNLTALVWLLGGVSVGSADEARNLEFFEKRIRPALVRHCYECHSVLTEKPKGGLRLDSRAAMRTGGESGPAVVPGKVAESLLIDALRHESFEMPPEEKLSDSVIADFVRWIEIGAPDPRDAPPTLKTASEFAWRRQFEERLQWWSLQPVAAPSPPMVKNQQWPLGLIDEFILAELENNNVSPAAAANRHVLVRRLSYALTGLPPTSEDVDAFINDRSPTAYERLVDRLLASPHFGERLARHWMDVVRYSDTYGYEWDIPAKGAWRYRDYLIRAFNGDVPFDQIAREHIAGDLIEPPRIDPVEQINESLIGVMFYQMGEKRHGDSAEFDGIHQEMLDNKIDAFSKAFQATTIACARCHDHRLDPIPQSGYYALGGVFMSSRWVVNTLDAPQRNAATIHRLGEIKTHLRAALATQWLKEIEQTPAAMLAVYARDKKTSESSRPPGLETWKKLLTFEEGKKPALEDVRYPWFQIVNSGPGDDSNDDNSNDGDSETLVSSRWEAVAKEYHAQQESREKQNAQDFEVIADFRHEIPEGWSVDGVGLRNRVPCGDFTVALAGPTAVGRVLRGGLFTHALSPRLNGAVRTPTLNQYAKAQISFETVGGDFAAHRTVVDNAFLTERQKFLVQPRPTWLRLSTFPNMRKRRIYIELATKTSNPNFPPRVGLGGKCTEEQTRDPRSWFGVTRVVLHDRAASPQDELSRFSDLFSGEPTRSLPDAANRYGRWFRAAIEAWSREEATEDDVRLINWMLENAVLANQHEVGSDVSTWVARYREVEKSLAVPQTAGGMADLEAGHDYRLNIRGNYDQLGDEVPRGYLEALTGSTDAFTSHGSGRRELADQVASLQNPLTARVFVNRVWYWLFGAGIVRTPNDFGHLGQQPSHPELLDHLASQFAQREWSVKTLVREIVLSQTWRQSGRPAKNAIALDPDNRLLHHYPLRRLEAEAIRDGMLAVSGHLDGQLFGPPINPHRQNEDPQKRLFSGPIDGEGRRSIYTKITIMEPPRLLAIFNQPEPKIPTGHRDVSNTPAQSLTLLNDPFVRGQAEQWAHRLIAMEGGTEKRLAFMFRSAFGRNPTDEEIQRWNSAVGEFAGFHSVSASEQASSHPVWTDIAHAIFNTKEFIYIR